MSKNDIRPEVKKAVALFYDGRGAPQITAKGEHEDARTIVDIAQEHDVPLCDNPALAELLSELELGDRVPEELYQAVAHIIAFAYQLKATDVEAPPEPQPKPFSF